MTIKGLSDKRRISRGGKLRLGSMATAANGKEYPQKSDHFIADFENKELEKEFYRIYGDKPTRVDICFPHADREANFTNFYKCYGATGLKCKGDGETAHRRDDRGELVEVDCPGPDNCAFGQQHQCKALGTLQFFIKGLPTLQIFQIDTGGYNSILNMNTQMELLQMARGGSLSAVWVPLVLREKSVEVFNAKSGKMTKSTIYMIDLEINCSIDEVMQLPTAFKPSAALPAPDETRDPLLYPVNGFAPEPDEMLSLRNDPDVIRHLDDLGFHGAAREQLLSRAEQKGVTAEAFMAATFELAERNKAAVAVASSEDDDFPLV